ncbi:MAG: COX15/CtaA family protein, partial [Verrucomicrobiota bacterium]
ALLAVIAQGVLGGLRVTLLKDEIGIFHALLAQAFLGLLVLIALLTSKSWFRFVAQCQVSGHARLLAKIAVATTAVIYFQLALGATMRHQHRDLAITDFPTAYRHWWPQTDPATLTRINAVREAAAISEVTGAQIWLQMAHRFGAVIIAGGITLFWAAARRAGVWPLHALSLAWLLGMMVQITLGAWTIWSNKAADITTAHVGIGATLLALGVAICAFSLRLQKGVSVWDIPTRHFQSEPVAV